jgi:cytochrome c553
MFKRIILITAAVLSSISLFIGSVYAAGDAQSGESKSAICASCHGAKGISSIPANPNIAGQVPGYIASQLKAFKDGERVNAIMAGQVLSLSEEDMADLDAYYSSMVPKVSTAMTDEDKVLAEAGRVIYRGGYAERGISACMSCHGPSGHGIPKNYPRVSAQHQSYLEQQLLAYKKGERKGYNDVMPNIAFGLSEQQIKELAAYMAGLN